MEKTAVSICHHCSLPVKRPVKHFESAGLEGRAGDGTRTRDSLLGRQVLTKIPFACYKLALEASSCNLSKWYAQMRQVLIFFSVRSYIAEGSYLLHPVGVYHGAGSKARVYREANQ